MEKRTYIQPEMSINMISSDAFVMIQPSNSNIEPNFAPKRMSPVNPTALATDTVPVF